VPGSNNDFPGNPLMAQTHPWHSIRSNDKSVYHDNDQCPVGRAIEDKYRKTGHRCRKRCPTCARLNSSVESAERLAQLTPL
jgi:hypothetical protein